jgi:hypothetical protein
MYCTVAAPDPVGQQQAIQRMVLCRGRLTFMVVVGAPGMVCMGAPEQRKGALMSSGQGRVRAGGQRPEHTFGLGRSTRRGGLGVAINTLLPLCAASWRLWREQHGTLATLRINTTHLRAAAAVAGAVAVAAAVAGAVAVAGAAAVA